MILKTVGELKEYLKDIPDDHIIGTGHGVKPTIMKFIQAKSDPDFFCDFDDLKLFEGTKFEFNDPFTTIVFC